MVVFLEYSDCHSMIYIVILVYKPTQTVFSTLLVNNTFFNHLNPNVLKISDNEFRLSNITKTFEFMIDKKINFASKGRIRVESIQ